MDEILPSAKISTKEYLRRLYDVARSESAEKTARQRIADKVSRSAQDANLRTSGASEDRLKRPERPTLNQAIDMAMKELETRK